MSICSTRGVRACSWPSSSESHKSNDALLASWRSSSTFRRSNHQTHAQYLSSTRSPAPLSNRESEGQIRNSKDEECHPRGYADMGSRHSACHFWWMRFHLQGRKVLTPQGQREYSFLFQQFSRPVGWPRNQSPKNHRGSWSLSELGRSIVLTPLVLRSNAIPSWFKSGYLAQARHSLRFLRSSAKRNLGIHRRPNYLCLFNIRLYYLSCLFGGTATCLHHSIFSYYDSPRSQSFSGTSSRSKPWF